VIQSPYREPGALPHGEGYWTSRRVKEMASAGILALSVLALVSALFFQRRTRESRLLMADPNVSPSPIGNQPPSSITPPPESPNERASAGTGRGDYDRTVAGLDLTKCFTGARMKLPQSEGSVVVVVTLDASGAVTSATAGGPAMLPADVATCLTMRVQGAHFAAPGGDGATFEIPIRFVAQ
jgi:hypothetical protein